MRRCIRSWLLTRGSAGSVLVVSESRMVGAPPPGVLGIQKAHYWLRQPTHRVQAHLASELGVNIQQLSDAADPEVTDVLRRIEPDVGDPPTQPLQTPAVPPTPRSPAGWPDLDHGGVGEPWTAPGLAVVHPRTHRRPFRAGRCCSPEASHDRSDRSRG